MPEEEAILLENMLEILDTAKNLESIFRLNVRSIFYIIIRYISVNINSIKIRLFELISSMYEISIILYKLDGISLVDISN